MWPSKNDESAQKTRGKRRDEEDDVEIVDEPTLDDFEDDLSPEERRRDPLRR